MYVHRLAAASRGDTDALQWAGWIWRGTAVWDKGNSRPQKGRFRQQAEYIVWGSNGDMPISRPVPCLPGVFKYGNPQSRIHLTEKPLQLMRDIVKITEPGGHILDLCRQRHHGAGGCAGGLYRHRHRSHRHLWELARNVSEPRCHRHRSHRTPRFICGAGTGTYPEGTLRRAPPEPALVRMATAADACLR